MAGLIPQSFIDDLLNRTDIVDVVSPASQAVARLAPVLTLPNSQRAQ